MSLKLPAIDEAYHRSAREPKGLVGAYALLITLAIMIVAGLLPLPKVPLLITIALFAGIGLLTSWVFFRFGFASFLYRFLNLIESTVLFTGLVVSMADHNADHPMLWAFYLFMAMIQAHAVGPALLGLFTVVMPPLAFLLVDQIARLGLSDAQRVQVLGYTVLASGLFLFYGRNRQGHMQLLAKQTQTEAALQAAHVELEAQRQVRSMENNWLEILQGMAAAFVLVDKQRCVLDIRAGDGLGEKIRAAIDHDWLNSVAHAFEEASDGKHVVSLYGHPLSGTNCYVDIKIAPLPSVCSETRYALLVHDATERVRLEEANKKFTEQAVLTDKLNSVGLLAAGIAHEVNNPLTFLGGHIEYLLMTEGANPRLRQSLQEMQEGIRQISSIMSDLRGFSRTASAGFRRTTDLRELVSRAQRLLQSEFKHGGRLIVDLPPEPVFIRCHPNRIQQVIVNLLVNARQALPNRSTAQNWVRVWIEVVDGVARLHVADNGVGMTEAVQRKIFDLFFTTKAPGQGTGLGLSLSYKFVREHDGDLTVVSSPGKGSTFTVSLPLSVKPAHELPILIVEDEERLLNLYSRVLCNFSVTTATSIAAAVPLLNQDFKVVLSDVRLPDGAGFDLYERAPSFLKNRFVFLTALPPDTPELAERPAGVRLLHKPIQLEQLEQELYAIALRAAS